GRPPATEEVSSPTEMRRTGWRGLFVALTILLLAALVVVTCNVWLTSRLVGQQREHSKEHAFWILCQPGYSPDVRRNAFLLLIAEGNKEWRSAHLSELDLDKASLAGAQLEGAAFRRAKFTGASLAAAKLNKSS